MSPPALCPIVLLVVLALASGKVYDKCELARELVNKHKASETDVATWVCIAYHESRFDTAAKGPTGDHGIFQISELYWCSPVGWACGVTCDSLRDDDIADDFKCARRVYRAHNQLAGDGFTAWAVYAPHCSSKEKAAQHVAGCFDQKLLSNETTEQTETPTAATVTVTSTTTTTTSTTTEKPTTVEATETEKKTDDAEKNEP